MDFKTMNIDDIIAWCKANNQVDWLKAEAKKTYINKNGKECPISFIQIKYDFCRMFMADIIPVAKEPKDTISMYDKIKNL